MSNKAKSITRDFQWICEDIFSRLSLRNLFWELTRFLCVQGQEIIRGLSDVKFAYTWIHFSILNHSSNHLIDQWYCQSHKLYLYFQLELSISSSKEFERILDDFFSFVFLKRSREFGVGRGGWWSTFIGWTIILQEGPLYCSYRSGGQNIQSQWSIAGQSELILHF